MNVLDSEAGTTNQLLLAVVTAWRTSSAAAHGHYHYSLSRIIEMEDTNELKAGDLGLITIDIAKDLGPLLMYSYLILIRTMRIFENRRMPFLTAETQ